eukprot:s325_g1.t1
MACTRESEKHEVCVWLAWCFEHCLKHEQDHVRTELKHCAASTPGCKFVCHKKSKDFLRWVENRKRSMLLIVTAFHRASRWAGKQGAGEEILVTLGFSLAATRTFIARHKQTVQEQLKHEVLPSCPLADLETRTSCSFSKSRMHMNCDFDFFCLMMHNWRNWRKMRLQPDRLEAFDLVERRTEEVAEKVQALDSDMENARSRSASPPRVAMRLRPEENPDLTLAGKGHAASRVEKPPSRIASPNFEGTGWARALPRRPYSAGSSRGADTPQLQQLREQLANLAGLPLALQKKLQASPGQSVFPSRPPSAGAAIALCRPQRPSSGLRARPLSAK